MRPKVTIFTDGGASPNPGPGGYGVLLIFPDKQQELSGGERDTTNNRMELTAACVALESLSEPHEVILYTDSEYVKNGITKWIANWVRKGWKDVKNPDLWQRLDAATQRHEIHWKWVRGHAGNANNERVDQLATAARDRILGKTPTATAPSAAPNAQYDYVVHTATDFDSKTKAGGWGVVIQQGDETKEYSGGGSNTTGYHMALAAAVTALENLPEAGSVQLITDNETVQKGATTWVKGWRKNGWKNSKGEPVAHKDLWQKIDQIIEDRTVKWQLGAGSSPRAAELAIDQRRKPKQG